MDFRKPHVFSVVGFDRAEREAEVHRISATYRCGLLNIGHLATHAVRPPPSTHGPFSIPYPYYYDYSAIIEHYQTAGKQLPAEIQCALILIAIRTSHTASFVLDNFPSDPWQVYTFADFVEPHIVYHAMIYLRSSRPHIIELIESYDREALSSSSGTYYSVSSENLEPGQHRRVSSPSVRPIVERRPEDLYHEFQTLWELSGLKQPHESQFAQTEFGFYAKADPQWSSRGIQTDPVIVEGKSDNTGTYTVLMNLVTVRSSSSATPEAATPVLKSACCSPQPSVSVSPSLEERTPTVEAGDKVMIPRRLPVDTPPSDILSPGTNSRSPSVPSESGDTGRQEDETDELALRPTSFGSPHTYSRYIESVSLNRSHDTSAKGTEVAQYAAALKASPSRDESVLVPKIEYARRSVATQVTHRHKGKRVKKQKRSDKDKNRSDGDHQQQKQKANVESGTFKKSPPKSALVLRALEEEEEYSEPAYRPEPCDPFAGYSYKTKSIRERVPSGRAALAKTDSTIVLVGESDNRVVKFCAQDVGRMKMKSQEHSTPPRSPGDGRKQQEESVQFLTTPLTSQAQELSDEYLSNVAGSSKHHSDSPAETSDDNEDTDNRSKRFTRKRILKTDTESSSDEEDFHLAKDNSPTKAENSEATASSDSSSSINAELRAERYLSDMSIVTDFFRLHGVLFVVQGEDRSEVVSNQIDRLLIGLDIPWLGPRAPSGSVVRTLSYRHF